MDLIKTSHNVQGYIDSRRGGRPENQDHYDYQDTPHGLLVVVCDGMGGGPSGKLAATIAVQRTIDYVMQANDNEAKDTILKDLSELDGKTMDELKEERIKKILNIGSVKQTNISFTEGFDKF